LEGEPTGPYRNTGAEIEEDAFGYSAPFLIDYNKMGHITEAIGSPGSWSYRADTMHVDAPAMGSKCSMAYKVPG
jgi:hypothetical protein